MKVFWGACLLLLPSWAWAASLTSTALGNDGEIYSVRTGAASELLPGQTETDPEAGVAVLDITLPGDPPARQILPATLGADIESAARVIFSKESGLLNVLWESRSGDEIRVFLARLEDSEWSAAEEVYFHPEGVRPLIGLTRDELHLDLDDTTSIDAERHIVHLAWPQETDAQPSKIGYAPVLLLNGVYAGAQEPLFLPHLNADPNQVGTALLPQTLHVSVQDDDLDRVTLTFGSSSSQRVTTYQLQFVAMEVAHFGDLIRDLILTSDRFDPTRLSSFADWLGVEIVAVGNRRFLRATTFLSPSVIDFVAAGSERYVLDHGAGYDESQLAELADAVKMNALELTSSLLSPSSGVAQNSAQASNSTTTVAAVHKSSIHEIDVPEVLENNNVPPHLLDLRFAVELPLPDTGGREMTLYTSEDGLRFLAAWTDAEAPETILWYVESDLEGAWGEPRALHLGEHLSAEEARGLLSERIR